MGGASRFVTLLALPFPTLLHPLRPSFFLLRRRLTTLRLRPLTASTKSKSHTPQILSQQQHFYSQPVHDNNYTLNSTQYNSHPWPEWTSFVNTISLSPIPNGHGATEPVSRQILPEDAFVEYEELSENFVRAAVSCLAFARDRPNLLGLLSKKEIEVIVSNGTPYLFKSALDSARRMRNFLGMDGSNVLESDIASLVDLMKYILSYASNPSLSSERNDLFSKELVELSVRNLLHELDKLSHGSPKMNMPNSVDQFSGGHGQTSGPIRPRIEMKRGDWICPKCSFMNFARNVKCLECEGPRPKRLLTGGEWECPQCDFFNYGRNTVCLRCDRSRPGVVPSNIGDTRLGYGRNGDFTHQTSIDSRLAENEEKAQRWFSKTSETSNISDVNTAASDEDFPDIMPLRKGENRFVINTRRTPLERRLASSQNQSMDPNKNLDTSANRSFDHKKTDSKYVPFVPLTPDMFSKKDQNLEVHENKVGTESSGLDSSAVSDQSTTSTGGSHHLGGDTASQEKEKEQTENSESWFEKVAKLHDPKDLTSAISEEDFPEIMPMRKGENQFVGSKKKNRSLTSPSYKRQVAMDEANNTNFVPFVPFPPGYFAKKTPQQPDVAESSTEPLVPTSESSSIPEKLDEPRYKLSNTNTTLRKADQPASSANSKFSGNLSGDRVGPPGENPKLNSSTAQPPLTAGSAELSGKQQGRSDWSGKSLEGSAVKDTDPFDMSEEAKAERWFRRVAQIKDISELSQIPDEDFPSIMPMRKGVNRFVVSKRKTPLEKRLTSQQYRRNLPVVTSDPLTNKGNNDD